MRLAKTHALALALLIAAGCGDDDAPPPGVSAGPPRVGGAEDAGSGPSHRLPTRPTDGPLLPPADAELEVVLGGESRVHRIEVEADLGALDVHLNIDTRASIGAEINRLQEDLEEVVIAQLRERVPDVSFGVSRFEDFPLAPYGSPGGEGNVPPDTPFELLTSVTADVEQISTAVAILDRPLGFGGDTFESGAEALYQIATGEGYRFGGRQIIDVFEAEEEPPPGTGTIGGVGFRDGALHVIMHVTDAPSHAPEDYGNNFPNTRSLDEAAEALNLVGARVIGIVSGLCPDEPDGEESAGGGGDGDMMDEPPDDADTGDGDAMEEDAEPGVCNGVERDSELYITTREQLEMLAHATGAIGPEQDGLCPHGLDGTDVPAFEETCPFVFDVAANGVGLSETVVDATVAFVNGVRFEAVTAQPTADPLGFIERIVPVEVEQEDDVEAPKVADRLPEEMPDGEEDSFVEVHAKARLGFDVHLRNDRIVPTDADQRFRVVVTVMGDDLIIAEPALRVVIPAGPPTLPPVDGGTGRDDDAGSP